MRRPSCFVLALGLLASVGGSPFLLPEARLFINAAVLEAIPGGLVALLVMALATTIFIWLYVDAVRRVALEDASEDTHTALGPMRGSSDSVRKPWAMVLPPGISFFARSTSTWIH